MSVEPTHGVYQPTGSPAPDRSWGRMLSIAYLLLAGDSTLFLAFFCAHISRGIYIWSLIKSEINTPVTLMNQIYALLDHPEKRAAFIVAFISNSPGGRRRKGSAAL